MHGAPATLDDVVNGLHREYPPATRPAGRHGQPLWQPVAVELLLPSDEQKWQPDEGRESEAAAQQQQGGGEASAGAAKAEQHRE